MTARPGIAKLVFFNRFFYPDPSATSQMLTDLAFHMAQAGHEVHVVASRVPQGELEEELVRGVRIHRVADSTQGDHGLPRKALDYYGFYRGARAAARKLLGPGDVAILLTDPPLLSVAVAPLVRRVRGKVVLWMQDLFPEVAREYGVPGLRGPLGNALLGRRDRSLALADDIVAIGELMAQRLRARPGVAADRVRTIHNWADGREIVPMTRAADGLRAQWSIGDDFVVAYSGNLGRVHEFQTLLGAASRLRAEKGVRFIFIGRGPRLGEVRESARRLGLANVEFRPLQERANLGRSLALADVHLSVLEPAYEGLVVPSKLYGIMAAARPTLFVGDPAGETGAILAASEAGLSVPKGDDAALARAILHLRDDAGRRQQLGRNARAYFERHYDMPIALRSWEAVPARLGA